MIPNIEEMIVTTILMINPSVIMYILCMVGTKLSILTIIVWEQSLLYDGDSKDS